MIKDILNIEHSNSNPYAGEIFTKQIQSLCEQCRSGVFTSAIVIIILWFFFDIVFSGTSYLVFACIIIALNGLTYFYLSDALLKFRSGQSDLTQGNIVAVLNLLAGLGYGLFFAVGLDTSSQALTFLSIFFVVTMCVGSVSVLAYYLPAYFANTISLITPMSIVLITSDSDTYLMLGIMLPTILLAGYGYAQNLNRTMAESFQLRFEKEGLVQELIEQKNTAEALRMVAEDANIAKSKFLAAASHDLRQPLHALTLFTEALEVSQKDAKQQRIVDKIKTSVSAMDSLFNALLDLSKLDAGIVTVHENNFPINELLLPLCLEYDKVSEKSEVEFSCETNDVNVKTDKILLEVIIRNLVGNAFRYTNSGKIWIHCFAKDLNKICIEIGDTGIGIPEDQTKKVFDEYYQLTNPERDREKGLGLGLAIVKRLINILHLEIELLSTVGKGSRFILTLDKGIPSQINSDKTSTNPDVILDKSSEIKVLVIDDDILVRDSIELLLSKWGYQNKVVESEQHAVDLIKNKNLIPDILIVDYQLKNNKTGIEAINKIQSCLSTPIPALVITGDILPDHLITVKQSQLPVLYKPVKPAQLRKFLLNSNKS